MTFFVVFVVAFFVRWFCLYFGWNYGVVGLFDFPTASMGQVFCLALFVHSIIPSTLSYNGKD